MPSHSHRRDFLTGKAAVRAVEDLADQISDQLPKLTPDHSPLTTRSAILLLHLSRRAMACDFQIFLNIDQHADGAERALEALDLVERLEDQLSVYRDQSEVSRLNRTAVGQYVPIEERLFALLQQAVALHGETGGAYDITSGPLTKAWGFFRRAGRIPTEHELAAALENVGSQYLQLDPERKTVHFGRPGLEINLGSIGKGYALDRCAEVLESAGIHDFLLHGGNSSVVARGSSERGRESISPVGTSSNATSCDGEIDSRPPSSAAADTVPSPGWTVGLRHPWRPDERIGVFHLRDLALGTSGSEAQFFLHEGRRYGHILDPRTGQPAEGVLTTTVLAPTGAQADSLSTAFYILGPKGTAEYCAQHSEISAVLVVPGSKSGAIEVLRYNVRDEDLACELRSL